MNTPPEPVDEPAIDRPRDEQDLTANRKPSCRHWAVATAVALAAFALTFAQTKDYGLLGYDSYPIIITSRIQSLADLVGNFTEELMDGRYAGDFYRPLLNFSFALDYAIWQLKPIGYQLTNALLFAGCAAALFALVRRLIGAGAFFAPLVAMLFFLLHPTHWEVVPVPPRRADLLCCLFLALSLTCQLAPKALAMRRPPILPAIFGLLAIASKETAFVLPALAYLAVVLYSPHRNVLKRAVHALIAIIPQLVAAAIMIAARIAVIGAIGGHHAAGLSAGPERFSTAISEIARLLLFPQPLVQATSLAAWLAGGVLLGLLVTGTLLAAIPRPHTTAARGPLRPGVFGLLWITLTSAAYATVGRIEPWYLLLPVAGLAIFLAAVVETLAAAVRGGRLPARAAATATLLLLLGLAGWQVRYSPFFQEYDEYERATAASNEFFEKLRKRIDTTPDGNAILAPPMPRWVRPRPDQPTVFGAAILMDYSVQAWTELACPDRRIRVASGPPVMIGSPASDELVVVLRALRRGFESAAPQVAPQPRPH